MPPALRSRIERFHGLKKRLSGMEYVKYLIDFILHIDVHLSELIRDYGVQTYVILFAIVFVETGLVVMPFLPGDSLLFAAGAFTAKGDFDLWLLGAALSIAAIAGDSLNYAIGHYFGPKVFSRDYRWLNRQHLVRTEAFYEKHGGKTITVRGRRRRDELSPLPCIQRRRRAVMGLELFVAGLFLRQSARGKK
jgi:membrane protein YqaA with SNARE-associated domain